MNITDLTVKKMDRSDPRYPALIEERPFTDVYLLTAILADGGAQEASFFVFREMTTDHASSMLKLFARAVNDMKVSEAA